MGVKNAPCTPPRREAICATQWLQKMRDMDRLACSLQEQVLRKYKQRYNLHTRESTEYFARRCDLGPSTTSAPY